MMMAELLLELSTILGRKATSLAHVVKRIDERPISMMMAELNLELSMIMGRKKLRSIAHLEGRLWIRRYYFRVCQRLVQIIDITLRDGETRCVGSL